MARSLTASNGANMTFSDVLGLVLLVAFLIALTVNGGARSGLFRRNRKGKK